MGRVATLQQQTFARARLRRIALDHDRAARDDRVEVAATEAILALGERDDALGQVRAAQGRVGDAVRRIIAEGIKVDGVALLCDISVREVRRLRRAADVAQDPRGIADPAGLDPAGPPEVTVRALDEVQARPRGMDPAHRSPQQPAATARVRCDVDELVPGRGDYPHPSAG
jgi:hypothetical protein